MARYIALLLMGILLVNSRVAQAEKTIEDYWEESSIELKNLRYFINDKKCYDDEKAFVACVKGLNGFADGLGNHDQQFYTQDFLTKHPQTAAAVIKQYSSLVLVKLNKKGEEKEKAFSVIVREGKKEEEKYVESLIAAFKKRPKIKFSALVSDVNSRIKSKTKFYIGVGLNEYVSFAFDPHSSIEPSVEFQVSMQGSKSFGGLGIEVEQDQAGVRVVGFATEESSALKAGLAEGDIITSAGDIKLAGLPMDKAIDYLRGDAESQVDLTVLRNAQNIKLTVTRKIVKIKNATAKVVSDFGDDYVYLQLHKFSEGSCEELFEETAKIQNTDKQPKGIILDLRGNPGGVIGEAECISQLFVGRKAIVTLKNLWTDKESTFQHKSLVLSPEAGETLSRVPLVVLVNARSASASEITAGALQDYKRAWLVGERTFGKGTAQVVRPTDAFPSFASLFGLGKGFTIKLTEDRFYLPNGTSNQIIGLTPEFITPYKPDATDEERFARREEDDFINAFTPVTDHRPNYRVDETQKIEACAAKKRAETIYANLIVAKKKADYQLLKAEEIMACSQQSPL